MTASRKTDNHNPSGKLKLRRYFLEKYHPANTAKVLDCCMGTGFLWNILAGEYKLSSYLGLDTKYKKGRLRIDSSRYLMAGDWDHNVIDVDTYGMPWKHWAKLLKTARGDLTVFLTIGFIRMGGGGNLSKEQKLAMGIDKLKNIPVSLAARLNRLSVQCCLALCLERFEVIECLEAENHGSARYFGIRLEEKKKKVLLN